MFHITECYETCPLYYVFALIFFFHFIKLLNMYFADDFCLKEAVHQLQDVGGLHPPLDHLVRARLVYF